MGKIVLQNTYALFTFLSLCWPYSPFLCAAIFFYPGTERSTYRTCREMLQIILITDCVASDRHVVCIEFQKGCLGKVLCRGPCHPAKLSQGMVEITFTPSH